MHENLTKNQINFVSNNIIKFIKQNLKKRFINGENFFPK